MATGETSTIPTDGDRVDARPGRLAGVGRIARASLLGVGVALVAIVVPVLHFCTGPLSGLIGGYLAATSIHARPHEAWRIGLGMAVVAVVPAAMLRLTSAGHLLPIPDDLRAGFDLVTLFLVPYLAVFGWFGARFAARAQHDDPPAEPAE